MIGATNPAFNRDHAVERLTISPTSSLGAGFSFETRCDCKRTGAIASVGACFSSWIVAPTARTRGWVVGLRGGLAMRHKPLLDSQVAYTADAIGLGLLPIAMAFTAVLIL